ncbi:SPOR domain-containing protein [Mesorhizobium sp. B2-4-17]|uniref:SPOR domain-containing protein n=1 Tax=Mesorhizobium sp. B2-4-17 TaxID=2589932 RepID=UPI001127F32A|nr:SPOR domain-containing protein [Mesorhizobium sp. B2-4-17]TPK81671.1 SPOR domain-containing protein [Mesorhizobium sp. B2-4-17]
MADRTQLRIADNNDIADDDPFAELTRIMGFDPRQPVKPQAPVPSQVTVAGPSVQEDDFDIDLEKELMGEFNAGDSVVAPVVEVHEPAFETAAIHAADDDLALSLDDDFHLDMADVDDQAVVASHASAAAADAAPSVEPAFDADFDNAVASSLEGVSPYEDDLPMEDELAASLDRDFHVEDEAAETQHAVAEEPVIEEPVSDHQFDDAVAMSLEDELMLDDHSADQHHAAAVEYPEPAQAAANEAQAVSDEAFAGHFDDAMADVGADFDIQADEPVAFDEAEADEVFTHAEETKGEIPSAEPVSDDAFDVNLDDAFAEPAEEPAAELAAAAVQPAATAAPAANMAEPAQAPMADERSLEDELNALLGAMTARAVPSAKEPAMAGPVVAQPAAIPIQSPVAAAKTTEEPADLVGELDWDLDEPASEEEMHHSDAAQAADTDPDNLLLDELQDLGSHATDADQVDVDIDNDAFDAALAKSLDPSDGAVFRQDQADSPDWQAERSAPAEPARSWSRVTPVPQQPAFAAQPAASMAAGAVAPEVAAMPPYHPTEPVAAAPYATPVSAPQPRQSSRYEEMPDVETVDVPERVVALADDLDIPELHFEEDEPAASGYDDLDAEFASLLTEMNSVDVAPAPAAAASSASHADESYNAGFNSGYEALNPGYEGLNPGYEGPNPGYEKLNPGYEKLNPGYALNQGYEQPKSAYQPEARTYAARPAEMPARGAATTGYANAADGFDLDSLPGSQPVSQADDFTVDELDYDPELDEAMSVPGLGEREAARPSGRRGLFIAAIVGAVAVAGGLGAFALSLGGKGGSEAPVIVKADNSPIKIKPENPGGTVVPNQDNKVYDAVVKGAKPAEPVQQKLVTNTEGPVDVQAKDPARAVDLSSGQSAAAGVTDEGNTAPIANAVATANAAPAASAPADNAAPAPKSEDRIAQVLQDADKGTSTDVVAVAPRKVRTMVVKSDGSLVPREDPAPAAPQVAATEPADPAPQHVAPSGQSDADQTGTVATAAAQADEPALKPAAKPPAKAQSANTPAKVPVAPQRPSDQPVDVVGEVKPDQVASIDPATAATGGSWSMQIASQPTVESAQSTYQDLQRRYGSVLSGRTANIVKAEIAGKGTFYRVRVPAQSRNDAINLCTSYKAAGGNCFVSR